MKYGNALSRSRPIPSLLRLTLADRRQPTSNARSVTPTGWILIAAGTIVLIAGAYIYYA